VRYSGRALRLIDVIALVLVGTGVLCLLLAAYTVVLLGTAPGRYGQDPRLWIVCYATLGITLTSLGAALNMQLLRVRANGGREPDRGPCGSSFMKILEKAGEPAPPEPAA
jgi:hypothetical protein